MYSPILQITRTSEYLLIRGRPIRPPCVTPLRVVLAVEGSGDASVNAKRSNRRCRGEAVYERTSRNGKNPVLVSTSTRRRAASNRRLIRDSSRSAIPGAAKIVRGANDSYREVLFRASVHPCACTYVPHTRPRFPGVRTRVRTCTWASVCVGAVARVSAMLPAVYVYARVSVLALRNDDTFA